MNILRPFLLSLLVFPLALVGQTITVTPESKTVGIGDTISVDINFSGYAGDLFTAQGTLEWDPDVLTFDSSLPGALSNFGLSGMTNADFGLTDVLFGRLYAGWSSPTGQGITPLPTWFTIKFIVVGNSGSSTFVELTDGPNQGGTPIEFTFPQPLFPGGPVLPQIFPVISVQGIISVGSGFPVTWGGLDAHKTSDGMLVSWETATELNNDFFAVERMVTDGVFEEVGTVTGVGTSDVTQSYTFLDIVAPEGRMFYRIKQVDLDGGFDYSQTIEAFNLVERFRMYPNPARDVLHVVIPASFQQGGFLILRDLRGMEVQKHQFEAYSELTLHVQDQAKGTYFVELVGQHGEKAIRNLILN